MAEGRGLKAVLAGYQRSARELRERHEARQECIDKLHPSRIKTGVRLQAYLACLIGVAEGWTVPKILTIAITSDDFAVVQPEGEHDFIESAADLRRNITGIASVAGLSDASRDWLLAKCRYRP